MFVRAWKNGKQIGFGSDGSVDIERIRIFNPPVLVPDPLGEYEKRWLDINGEEKVEKFREDAHEAILTDLYHTIEVLKNKEIGSDKILKGKVGKTISTFYPEEDGRSTEFNDPSTWATIRGATGNEVDRTGPTMGVNLTPSSTTNRWRRISRANLRFNTAAIPDGDTINAATISLYGQTKADSHSISPTLLTTANSRTSGNIEGSDYSAHYTLNTPAEFASRFAYASFTLEAYNDITLNASGRSHINKTGPTSFGFRESNDADNTEPAWASTFSTVFWWYSVDETGTTKDPKLVVDHTAPVVPQTLTANAHGSANEIIQAGKNITALAHGAASVLKGMFQTLTASASGLATLVSSRLFPKEIMANIIGSASMDKGLVFVREMIAQLTGAASFAKQVGKNITAQALGSASLILVRSKILVASAVASAIETAVVAKILSAAAHARVKFTEMFFKRKYTKQGDNYQRKY